MVSFTYQANLRVALFYAATLSSARINFLLHVVVPVLALGEWALATPSHSAVRWWHPWAWLVYRGCYLVIALAAPVRR